MGEDNKSHSDEVKAAAAGKWSTVGWGLNFRSPELVRKLHRGRVLKIPGILSPLKQNRPQIIHLQATDS
jgi:hypothetical protein